MHFGGVKNKNLAPHFYFQKALTAWLRGFLKVSKKKKKKREETEKICVKGLLKYRCPHVFVEKTWGNTISRAVESCD